jgi:hypothetical protein
MQISGYPLFTNNSQFPVAICIINSDVGPFELKAIDRDIMIIL